MSAAKPVVFGRDVIREPRDDGWEDVKPGRRYIEIDGVRHYIDDETPRPKYEPPIFQLDGA